MKKNLDDLYNDEMDKLLFDYLEGSLNIDIAAEIESKLAYNSNLQEELKFWKEAYVEQDFYDTMVLEGKLQKATVEMGKVSSGKYFLLMIFFVSFLSFMPLSLDKESLDTYEFESHTSTTFEEVKSSLQNNILAKEDGLPQVVTEGKTELKQNYKIHFTERNQIKLEILETRPLTNMGSETIRIPENRPLPSASKNKIAKEQNVYVSKISKKEQRAIEKVREKALQKRRHENYRRGGKPYVVPLNPNF